MIIVRSMEEKEISSMNVIPLVDIMLVLLTIVLTTATFIAKGEIPVELPEAKSGKAVQPQESVVITITKEGKIYLKSREVSYEELKEFLKTLNRQTPVEINADKNAKLENFVKVFDLLNQYGFKNVNLLVKKE
ncbi:ExbD/TolR family protein [Aquifex aeolicus]|uniref:Biopolymer transport protein ExbD n=1 Tax=Aquifex aeolicus (strain VF5) TaxID=224324 RepID=EXBD_AQUAE|nr:biopolymer transporter ExbD [Aquifex aeolicus]O67694.1 RecName: Full=Biopolymer transport protein ExbD [Aquifex aeolicus VF5]AAC07651.1 biopolymer transport ExbD [Aquifex aeolicus VF5]